MQKKNKWKAYIADLLVVIVGITIAFALENFSNNKKQDRLEVNYLNSLKSDLEKDKEDLRLIMDSANVILQHIGEVFQYNYSGRPLTDYKRHHITSSYLATYFYPQNGTYVSLINSGDINVIQDFELKTALSNLYNIQYQELQRRDNVIRNLVDNMIQPYMIDNIRFSFDRDGIEDATPLKTNKAINMLGSFFNLLSARQQAYQEMMVKCDSLIMIIDESPL